MLSLVNSIDLFLIFFSFEFFVVMMASTHHKSVYIHLLKHNVVVADSLGDAPNDPMSNYSIHQNRLVDCQVRLCSDAFASLSNEVR